LTLPKGTKVQRIDNYSRTGDGYVWAAIKYNDETYYVVDSYLSETYISSSTNIAASAITVSDIPDQVFTMKAITPSVTVKDGFTTLTEGTDYTLSYSNNIWSGSNATVTITGIGNYTGSRKVTFTIYQTTTDYYTTDALNARDFPSTSTGNVILTLPKGTKVQRIDNYSRTGDGYVWAAIKYNGETYYVVDSYLSKTYISSSTNIAASAITVSDIPDQVFTMKAITPSVTVKDGSTLLTEGTDYTLSYSNNIWSGSNATVTITGIGKYTGSRKVTFTIYQTTTDYYTTDALNARDFPSTSTGNVILTLPKGTKVQRIDNYSRTGDGYVWAAIKYNGETYYVVDEYLTKA
ncbi:MAG: hypothetical protein ACOYJO_06895, partial [Eubacterium sp.]